MGGAELAPTPATAHATHAPRRSSSSSSSGASRPPWTTEGETAGTVETGTGTARGVGRGWAVEVAAAEEVLTGRRAAGTEATAVVDTAATAVGMAEAVAGEEDLVATAAEVGEVMVATAVVAAAAAAAHTAHLAAAVSAAVTRAAASGAVAGEHFSYVFGRKV